MERNFYVIVYDVTDDKRRSKVAKYLESLGERAQYSVFEAYLTPAEKDKLLKKMTKLIDKELDGLRVYNICEACRGRVDSLGQGQVTPPPGLVIV